MFSFYLREPVSFRWLNHTSWCIFASILHQEIVIKVHCKRLNLINVIFYWILTGPFSLVFSHTLPPLIILLLAPPRQKKKPLIILGNLKLLLLFFNSLFHWILLTWSHILSISFSYHIISHLSGLPLDVIYLIVEQK